MDELLKLMRAICEGIEALGRIFSELNIVLDHEEQIIATYSLTELERVVVEKDQLVQRATSAEQRRLRSYERLFFLIGYDARGTLPTLTEFEIIFQAYLNNITPLVDENTVFALNEAYHEFLTKGRELQAQYRELSPRIYRNRQVLTKMANHFSRSVQIFESEMTAARHYDGTGRAKTHVGRGETVSSLRVKA
jgi:flagellar biosynthesis/type III secretory pathway chaperone